MIFNEVVNCIFTVVFLIISIITYALKRMNLGIVMIFGYCIMGCIGLYMFKYYTKFFVVVVMICYFVIMVFSVVRYAHHNNIESYNKDTSKDKVAISLGVVAFLLSSVNVVCAVREDVLESFWTSIAQKGKKKLQQQLQDQTSDSDIYQNPQKSYYVGSSDSDIYQNPQKNYKVERSIYDNPQKSYYVASSDSDIYENPSNWS